MLRLTCRSTLSLSLDLDHPREQLLPVRLVVGHAISKVKTITFRKQKLRFAQHYILVVVEEAQL